MEGEALGVSGMSQPAGDQRADRGVGAGHRKDGDAGGDGRGRDLAAGSAMPGVPASLTTAMRAPALSSAAKLVGAPGLVVLW